MDHESEVIKQQMEQTRSSLTDKLETLEEHVASSVRSTTDAVTGTVEAVKGAVEETVQSVSDSVESVKETFDLSRQIRDNPWLVLGGAVVVGYLGSSLFEKGISEGSRGEARSGAPSHSSHRKSHGNGHHRPSAERSEPSTWDKLAETFRPTVEKLEALALGTATGLVGKMVLESIPEGLRGEVEQVIDEFTHALGGKSIPAVLHPNPAESRTSAPPSRS
jgi:ElaB/YqjD/DUF883 family membrane-anchored ribosome-binding protein